MSRVRIPANLEEITPSWLTRALRGTDVGKATTVVAIESAATGTGTRFYGNLTRLRLSHDPANSHGP
jgi:hypothetical protein